MTSSDLIYHSIMEQVAGGDLVRVPIASGAYKMVFPILSDDKRFDYWCLAASKVRRSHHEGITPEADIEDLSITLDERETPDADTFSKSERAKFERLAKAEQLDPNQIDRALLNEQLGRTSALHQGMLVPVFQGIDLNLFGQAQASTLPLAGESDVPAVSFMHWVPGITLGAFMEKNGNRSWDILNTLPSSSYVDLMKQFRLLREESHLTDFMHPNNILIDLAGGKQGKRAFTLIDIKHYESRFVEETNVAEQLIRQFFPRLENYKAAEDAQSKLLDTLVSAAEKVGMGTKFDERSVMESLETTGYARIKGSHKLHHFYTSLSRENIEAAAERIARIPAPEILKWDMPEPELPLALSKLGRFDLKLPEMKMLRWLQDVATTREGRGIERL